MKLLILDWKTMIRLSLIPCKSTDYLSNINIRFREVNDPDYCYMLHEIIEHETDCGGMILSIILDLDF